MRRTWHGRGRGAVAGEISVSVWYGELVVD
jgi:hypothetical protein